METETRNGLIAVFLTIGAVVGVVLLYRKYYPANKDGNQENFAQLTTNLGGIKPDKNMIITIYFNDKKNTAYFYNNGRVIIFAGGKPVLRGNYSNGGKTIILDADVNADRKEASSESVYENLNNIIIK